VSLEGRATGGRVGYSLGVLGGSAVHRLMERTGKQSFASLSIAVVIIISVVCMGYQSLLELMEDPRSATHFSALCSSSKVGE
jgi:hypothetical protein